MQTIQQIALDKLVPSKENVRKAASSGIEGLAENIHAVRGHTKWRDLQKRWDWLAGDQNKLLGRRLRVGQPGRPRRPRSQFQLHGSG